MKDALIDTEDGSLMVTLGIYTHQAISLASDGDPTELRLFQPVASLDWREWVSVDDPQWDVPLHLAVAPRWDAAAAEYLAAVDAAG